MRLWERAGGLCDVAIEGLRQCGEARGEARERLWATPSKAMGELSALLASGGSATEWERAGAREFKAVERASLGYPGWGDWGFSAGACSEGRRLLGSAGLASLGLGRFASLARGIARRGYVETETRRADVGGKLLKIMKEAHLLWTDAGRGTPRSDAARDLALGLHGRWCAKAGALAESDWEMGIHAYGYGTWLDEFESGKLGGPTMLWRDQLLEASERCVERFGRLPQMPKGHGPVEPHWMVLENYAGHSAANGMPRAQWLWCIQFPLAGVSAWDKAAAAKAQWADESLLADSDWGRPALLERMLRDKLGEGRELSEFMAAQGRWRAMREARELRAELAPKAEAEGEAKPPRGRARSI